MEILSIVPPIAAIAFVMWKKDVIAALLLALFISETLIVGFNPAGGFTATLERIAAVFASADNARILLFSLLVGALIMLVNRSGGVGAFVNFLVRKNLAKNKRQAGLLAAITGVIVFIESNLSILTAGIVSRGLFDRFGMSRARLAYIIDSTCAPVCALILLNGWGAYLLSLISGYDLENPVATLVMTVPLNFYCLLTIAIVFYTVITDRIHGPMRNSENNKSNVTTDIDEAPTKTRYMIIPMAAMIFGMVLFLWLTGEGDIINGSGSRSVLWAVSLAILIAYFLLRWDNLFTHETLIKQSFEGMSNLLPLVTVVLLSLALGGSLKILGTGTFIASLLGEFLPVVLMTPLLFLIGCFISFTTGTSWGTFGILIPIGVPLAQAFGLPPELVIAAIIGGGVFGDHCSPISDTTIMASLVSGCDHLEHVRTQLPYALTAGGLSLVLYFIAGFFV